MTTEDAGDASGLRVLALFGSRVMMGQERANLEALAALRERGCEVLCLVRHEEWNSHVQAALEARDLPCRRVQYIDGWLRGWRLHILLRNPFALLIGNWQYLGAVSDFRPTHIHAFNPLYVLSFLPGLTLSRMPMIYRCGDSPVRHNWLWRLVWRFIVWRASFFVADSRFIMSLLKQAGVPAEKIAVFHSAIPKRLLTPDASAEGIPEPGKAFTYLYVGAIAPFKGVDILVAAVETVLDVYPNIRLLVAGRISDWEGDKWARDLRACVESNEKLSQAVHFLGFRENVDALFKTAHVHVMPSVVEEALGLVVLEAKRAGRPSIVFPSGGLTELVSHRIDGYVCSSKSVENLAEALAYYLEEPERCHVQGRNAALSLDALELDSYPQRLQSLYASVR